MAGREARVKELAASYFAAYAVHGVVPLEDLPAVAQRFFEDARLVPPSLADVQDIAAACEPYHGGLGSQEFARFFTYLVHEAACAASAEAPAPAYQHGESDSDTTVATESAQPAIVNAAVQALLNVQALDPKVFEQALLLGPGPELKRSELLQYLQGGEGCRVLDAEKVLQADIAGLNSRELGIVMRDLGVDDTDDGDEDARSMVVELLSAAPAETVDAAVEVVATGRLQKFFARRGVAWSREKTAALRSPGERWAAVWERVRHQYPSGREAIAGIAERTRRRVFVIGPGFGLRASPELIESIQDGGYVVHKCVKIPNPDQYLKRHSSLDAPMKVLWRELREFRPDVIVGASKGGAYLLELWEDRNFNVPTVMLNAHPKMKALPRGVPVVVHQGSKDQTFRRIREHVAVRLDDHLRNELVDVLSFGPCRRTGDSPCLMVSEKVKRKGGSIPKNAVLLPDALVDLDSRTKEVAPVSTIAELKALKLPATVYFRHGREDLEQLVDGCPQAFLSLSTSGVSLAAGKLIRTRSGDEHTPLHSLLRSNGLCRLLDAAISGTPEEHVHETLQLLCPERREAEAFLGFEPQALVRLWSSQEWEPRRVAVPRSSEEYAAVRRILEDAPAGRYYDFGTSWRPQILGLDRVESLGQVKGTQSFYERVRRSLREQDVAMTGGVHARWLFHGSPALDSIVADPVTGFRPLLSSAAIWGRGVYFARDALYPHDHGYAREVEGDNVAPGVRQMLLCLVVTGMSVLGDPTYSILPQRRDEGHRYNSYVDSVLDPEIYVTTLAAGAFPAYVITYRNDEY